MSSLVNELKKWIPEPCYISATKNTDSSIDHIWCAEPFLEVILSCYYWSLQGSNFLHMLFLSSQMIALLYVPFSGLLLEYWRLKNSTYEASLFQDPMRNSCSTLSCHWEIVVPISVHDWSLGKIYISISTYLSSTCMYAPPGFWIIEGW